MSKIDHQLSELSEKEITKVVKKLGCKVSSLSVHMNNFDMNVVELEVKLAKSNLFARIVIEVNKGKWVGFAEIEGLPYSEYKEVSFSSEDGWVSGSDAVYRILDNILATKKIVYDTSFL